MTTPKPITVERLSDWERSVDEDSYRDVRATVEALDTAQKRIAFLEQRERDICTAVGGVSDGGQYRNDIGEGAARERQGRGRLRARGPR